MNRRNGFVGIALLGTLGVLVMAETADAQRLLRRNRNNGPNYYTPTTQPVSQPAQTPGQPTPMPQPAQQQPGAESAAPAQQVPVQTMRRGRRGRVYYQTTMMPATDATSPQARMSYYPTTAAQIQVRLPNPEAEVQFDGTTTKQKGMMRTFTTPPLDGAYQYQISIAWQQDGQRMTRERTVSVRPGAQVSVDFTKEGGVRPNR